MRLLFNKTVQRFKRPNVLCEYVALEHSNRSIISSNETSLAGAIAGQNSTDHGSNHGSMKLVPGNQATMREISLLTDTVLKTRKSDTPTDTLTDKFNRKHTYLRISLSERCNLRCNLIKYKTNDIRHVLYA